MRVGWKKFILTAFVVFIAQSAVSGILFSTVVDKSASVPEFFRTEGEEMVLPYVLSRVVFVLTFSFLYIRFISASQKSGIVEGLKYGLLIWLLYSIPMTIGFWSFIKLPDVIAISWIAIGLCEFMAGGAVVSLMLKPAKMTRIPSNI